MADATNTTREQARITVTVNGVAYEGWQQSEVERNLEQLGGTFHIPVTLVPGNPPPINRQDWVEVHIGQARVLSGFVLAAEPAYDRTNCGLRVVGRDRTADLVHSSAVHQGGQWRKAGLDRICKDILAPFGIPLVVATDLGEVINDFKLAHGEVALDALARAARLRGVLLTSDDAGRLVLTRAGAERFDGVIMRGQNVISMQGVGSDERRHSQYIVYGQANMLSLDFDAARTLKATSRDDEIERYLPLVINADGNVTQAELQALVDHTKRVRRGHALGLRYVVEGWTWKGQPWPLNARVQIVDDVAGIQPGQEWLIAGVRYTCSLEMGDVTELTVRPIEAYDSVPLKSLPHYRRWGRKDGLDNRGPTDGAKGP